MLDIPQVTVPLALVALVLITRYLSARRRTLPLPPGPQGLPFLGNILGIPSVYPWKTYHQWARHTDSDIIHLSMAGRSLLIIDTFAAFTEILERRSGIYSSRPPMSMMAELAGWDWSFSVMPYGSRWRSHRRLMHQSFNFQAVKQFQPQVVDATHALLKGFRQTPQHFKEHVQLLASQVMLGSIYGHEVDSPYHPYVANVEKAMTGFANPKLTGIRAVEFIPGLTYLPSWFPGAGFKRDAEEWRTSVMRYMEEPMRDAVIEMAAGKGKQSFVSDQLERIAQSADAGAHSEFIKHVAATIHGAAFETTASTLLTFILVMAVFPEVQQRAREELDRVLNGELPTFQDEESLPYMQGLRMELLRWHPAVPTSVPHYNDVEDEYQGLRIPANSIILTNSWAMLHDETEYPDPESFNPDRFLRKDGCINTSVRDPRLVAFGSGRRICPGRYFAESVLFMTMASILTVFDISEAVNEQGKTLDVSTVEFSSGMVSSPKPFKCTMLPRSEKAARLIDSMIV